MSDIIVSVQEIDMLSTAQVQENDLVNVVSAIYNPATVARLGNIGDVDTSTLTDGSVLVYRTTTNKWTSTINLDLQNMEGGEY